MEDIKAAVNEHIDQVAELVEKLSAEIRTGFQPAYDNFIGFFHAINWKEPWIIGLLGFHIFLLLTVVLTRRNMNFQMFLFLLALVGVYSAEWFNSFLRSHWKSFSGQNYFDLHGLFLSVIWSGPLLVIAIIILVNTLFAVCYLIVRWKKAELRHRARLARSKED